MTYTAPGKSHREGLSIIELMDMFPTEEAATEWFESVIWPDGKRHCQKCGSTATRPVPNAKPMPYWCRDCRSYFSVRTGTPMQRSHIPLRKWAIGIYLCLTSLKSVSSMKLHRDLKISQPAAWFMLHRIREAWGGEGEGPFDGPVEVDETYFGGKRRNMSNAQRRELVKEGAGRGAVGKVAVVGAKCRTSNQVRAEVVEATDKATLHDFVEDSADDGATVFTDDAAAYNGIPFDHETVKHSVSEYVKRHGAHQRDRVLLVHAQAGAQGHLPQDQPEASEPLRAGVRREAQRPPVRNACADAGHGLRGWVGRRLLYSDLIADNGLPSGARS